MIEAALWIALGAFVGWNLPQPKWAATVQARVVGFLKGLVS